jgi:hypothetical protein
MCVGVVDALPWGHGQYSKLNYYEHKSWPGLRQPLGSGCALPENAFRPQIKVSFRGKERSRDLSPVHFRFPCSSEKRDGRSALDDMLTSVVIFGSVICFESPDEHREYNAGKHSHLYVTK